MTSQIYISKRCGHSIRLLKELKERPDIQGKIKIISIDEEPFPNYIKNVPTMVNGNKIYNAGEIFNMLEESKRVLLQRQNMQQQAEPNQQPIQQQQQQPIQQQQQQQQQQPIQQQQRIQSEPTRDNKPQETNPNMGCPIGSGEEKECNVDGFCMDSSCLAFSQLDGSDDLLGNNAVGDFSPIDFKDDSSKEIQGTGNSRKTSQMDSDYERMMKERGELNPRPKMM